MDTKLDQNLEQLAEKVESKIKPLSDVEDYINLMIYSRAGIGKTVWASKAPKPLLVNYESGTMSLNEENLGPEVLERVDVLFPDNFKDLNSIATYLRDYDHGYKTVILDSITEIQNASLDTILRDPNRKSSLDKDNPTLNDYGKCTNQMRKLLRFFRDLPMHVIFTALESKDKDELSGAISVGPAMTPKLRENIEGYVDIIGYMFVSKDQDNNPTRKILWQPDGKYMAKDRSRKLGKGFGNIDKGFEEVHQIICGRND